MSQIKVGMMAPTVVLRDTAGQAVSLADYWQAGQRVWLVFLRHLA